MIFDVLINQHKRCFFQKIANTQKDIINEIILSKHLVKTIDITKTSYKYCIYDNGCHLDESVKAHIDSHKSLKDMKFYIDRFHLKNHKRKV